MVSPEVVIVGRKDRLPVSWRLPESRRFLPDVIDSGDLLKRALIGIRERLMKRPLSLILGFRAVVRLLGGYSS